MSASIVISIERRTCGMLRRPRLEESPDGPARRRQPRPAFTLTDQHGKKVKLTDFKGKKVVVYFYPKADTPGCTTQSCALRDAEPDLKKLKAVVLGISPDTPEKQAKFDEKYGLGFTLLADTEHTVAEKYGVWGEKVNYGRKYMGIIRSAFVIDEHGQARGRVLQGQPEGHGPEGHQGARGAGLTSHPVLAWRTRDIADQPRQNDQGQAPTAWKPPSTWTFSPVVAGNQSESSATHGLGDRLGVLDVPPERRPLGPRPLRSFSKPGMLFAAMLAERARRRRG